MSEELASWQLPVFEHISVDCPGWWWYIWSKHRAEF